MSTIAQILGSLCLVATIISYLLKNHTQYLIASLTINGLYAIQYFILGGISGFIASLIALTRTGVFYVYKVKNKKPSIYLLILFEVIMLIFGVITYKDILSLIPIATGCLFTWVAWQSSYKVVCIAGMLVGILWCFYNYYVGAYVTILTGIFEFCASLIGLIKQCKQEKTYK